MDGTNIADIVNTLNKYNKNCPIKIVSYSNDKKFINNQLIQLGYIDKEGNISNNINKNITISFDEFDVIPLDEYLGYESILYTFIKGAYNLSPLEKYIYSYDIVKQFKEYAQVDESLEKDKNLSEDELADLSRNIYKVINNDYMVCTGYTNLLKDLLNKLDVPCTKLSVQVELSGYAAVDKLKKENPNWKDLSPLEKYNLIEQEKVNIPHNEYEDHSRMMVNIHDDKYGVDGVYFADPTFDNSIEKNYYTHLLMTNEDIDSNINKLKFEPRNILFYAKDKKEYKEMFKVALEKSMKNLEEKKSPLSKIEEIKKLIRDRYLASLKELCPNEYIMLEEKYPFIKGVNSWPIESEYKFGDEINNLLNDMADLIINSKGKKLTKETLYGAVKEVYSNVYENGLTNEDINKLIETNDKNEIGNYGEVRTK